MPSYSQQFVDISNTIKLAYRLYNQNNATGIPVLCLAGLTRNSADFDTLARELCQQHPVYCLDMRGRGLSSHDPDFQNYNPIVEATDVVTFIQALGLQEVAIIGTSRGGLLAMLLHSMLKGVIKGVVLNDIGAEINPKGLARIISYVGKERKDVRTWDEAVSVLKSAQQSQYPNMTDDQWLEFAKRTCVETTEGILGPNYDLAIKHTLIENKSDKLTDLWTPFLALRDIPTLLIHGELSDILSNETVARMKRSHPEMDVFTVRETGHAPFLDENSCIERISRFLKKVDVHTSQQKHSA
jgi:pimeloyl-ACP methyl ester carboxylesterase